MASYTMQLRKVCFYYGRDEVESWFKNYSLNDFLVQKQIDVIEKAGIWTKDKLAKKIVDHYYMREIGLETPALFKHYAYVSMNEIMERKLPKIYSNFLEYEPLVNVDYIEEYERNIEGNNTIDGSSSSNSSNTSNTLNINNDTPQQKITKQNLSTGAYASNVNQNENLSNINDETLTSSSGNSESKEIFKRRERGNNGVSVTAQRLIDDYRNIIVAIDEEIILELNSLFMSIY